MIMDSSACMVPSSLALRLSSLRVDSRHEGLWRLTGNDFFYAKDHVAKAPVLYRKCLSRAQRGEYLLPCGPALAVDHSIAGFCLGHRHSPLVLSRSRFCSGWHQALPAKGFLNQAGI